MAPDDGHGGHLSEIAAHIRGIPVINNVSGLGTAFMRAGLLTAIATFLYKRAFRRSRTVFFQNGDDRQLFVDQGIVRDEQAQLLPGSRIDLKGFAATGLHPNSARGVTFLLVGQLPWDKGLREYLELSSYSNYESTARLKIALTFLIYN